MKSELQKMEDIIEELEEKLKSMEGNNGLYG
jgi:flagellin-specific chaperone FliS